MKLNVISGIADGVAKIGGLFTSDKDKLQWENAIKETENMPTIQRLILDLATVNAKSKFVSGARSSLIYVLGAVAVYETIVRDIVWAINGIENPPATIASESMVILANFLGS